MTARPHITRTLAALALAASAAAPAIAGRPLVVDDANTNEKGAGHVEAWLTRIEGSNVYTIAPAYAPIDGLEFSATFARETAPRPTPPRCS